MRPNVRSFHMFEGEGAKDPEAKKRDSLSAFHDVTLR